MSIVLDGVRRDDHDWHNGHVEVSGREMAISCDDNCRRLFHGLSTGHSVHHAG